MEEENQQSIEPENEKLQVVEEKKNNQVKQAENSHSLPLFILKLLIFAACYATFHLGKYSIPLNDVKQVVDPVHDLFQYPNDLINKYETLARVLQISSSLVMDVTIMSTYIYWLFITFNCRFPFTFIAFYFIRGLNQQLIYLPIPEGNYWEDPNFFSLTVPYGKSSDFFYSGHTGALFICFLEWHTLKNPLMKKILLASLVYIILILIIFRTHYAIDITTALIYAHYIYMFISKHHKTIDDTIKNAVDKLINPFQSLFQNEKVVSIQKMTSQPSIEMGYNL